jgi:lipoprotein-anchoring transpeptidase ErfK/SrfK
VVVTVSKRARVLRVEGADRAVLLQAPVTVGSEHDRLPIGEWAVTGLSPNPVFHYNPDLFWDAEPSHSMAHIQPGPNNPVGVMWIGVTREHYGLHGTPEPARVGHTASHGCVRLTNWDVLRVAARVTKGTRVVFEE